MRLNARRRLRQRPAARSLAANLIVGPVAEKQLGAGFKDAIARLRYGTVAINAWSGLGYQVTQTP